MRTVRPLTILAVLLSTAALAQGTGKDLALPSLAPMIESVKGAVVNVDVQKRALSDEQLEFFKRYFGGRKGQGAPLNPGMGSGFIIDEKGLVLTNNHVVQDAVTIRVRLDDGRSFDADVLGRDPLTDVALIKLRGKVEKLPAVKLGSSSAMRVGDWVLAIGNPFGLASSVSLGIVSALDRDIGMGRYDQFLQTDAAINPGNSGGPLFNLKGEVVGINTAIVGAATGIGFAVPSDLVQAIVPQLEKSGAVTRGWLGVGVQDVSPSLARALGYGSSEGALLTQVNAGSPAAKGGLKAEDLVLLIDGDKVRTAHDLTGIVALKRPGSQVTVQVLRDGKVLTFKVMLGTRPDLEGIGEAPAPKEVAPSDGRRLGLSFQDIDPRNGRVLGVSAGAQVVGILPGSPAEKSGLKEGMVITEINRRPVRSRDELVAALKAIKSGAVALLRVAAPGGNTTLMGLEVP